MGLRSSVSTSCEGCVSDFSTMLTPQGSCGALSNSEEGADELLDSSCLSLALCVVWTALISCGHQQFSDCFMSSLVLLAWRVLLACAPKDLALVAPSLSNPQDSSHAASCIESVGLSSCVCMSTPTYDRFSKEVTGNFAKLGASVWSSSPAPSAPIVTCSSPNPVPLHGPPFGKQVSSGRSSLLSSCVLASVASPNGCLPIRNIVYPTLQLNQCCDVSSSVSEKVNCKSVHELVVEDSANSSHSAASVTSSSPTSFAPLGTRSTPYPVTRHGGFVGCHVAAGAAAAAAESPDLAAAAAAPWSVSLPSSCAVQVSSMSTSSAELYFDDSVPVVQSVDAPASQSIQCVDPDSSLFSFSKINCDSAGEELPANSPGALPALSLPVLSKVTVCLLSCSCVSLIPLLYDSSIASEAARAAAVIFCECPDVGFIVDSLIPPPVVLTSANPGLVGKLAGAVGVDFANEMNDYMQLHLSKSTGQEQVSPDVLSAGVIQSEVACDNDHSHVSPAPKVWSRSKSPKLQATSFNGNSWSGIKAFLRSTASSIVLCQEHKLLLSDLPEARLWAKSNGWNSFWAAAALTVKGGKSGGVVVFARSFIQAWVPEALQTPIWAHRATGVVISAGGLGPTLYVSVYGFTNSSAKVTATPSNLKVLAAVGEIAKTIGLPTVVGGDFNMEPHVVRNASMFLESFGFCAFSPTAQIGSCLSKGADGGVSISTIDFFLLTLDLADAVDSIDYCLDTPPRPHRPTCLSFKSRPKDIKVVTLQEPRRLPVAPPFGPITPPASFSSVLHQAKSDVLSVLGGPASGDFCRSFLPSKVDEIQVALDTALDSWFECAEDALCDVLGVKTQAVGRGKVQKEIKVNLINTFKVKTGGGCVLSRAYRWFQTRFIDLSSAITAWASASSFSSLLSSFRRTRDLINATIKGGRVRTPFGKMKLDMNKVWAPKLAKVAKHARQLIVLFGCSIPSLSVAQSIAARCDMFASLALADAISAEKAELSSNSAAWKAWAASAGENGAGIAHKYSKLPLSINTEDIIGTNHNRKDVIDSEVIKWSALWNEGGTSPPLAYGSVPLPPPLRSSDVVRAASSFKDATCALAGIHPKHIALLNPQALDVLCTILSAAEEAGIIPRQLAKNQINLLAKRTEGVRPICWAQSVFRVWMKSRACFAKQWEVSHTTPLGSFAAERGKAPCDVVWRHAFKSEAAKAQKSHFGIVLWDLKKCYDMVDHHQLVKAALRHGYPLFLLRLSICSYRADRRIVYKGMVSRVMRAQRGILAGNCFATTELRLILLSIVQQHQIHHPSVSLSVFIDDLSLDATASSSRAVVDKLSDAAFDLAIQLEQDALLPIARDKSAVLSNSLVTANLLRRTLRDLGGPPLTSVRSLGFDFFAAAPKRPRFAVRALRKLDQAKRCKRLLALKGGSKKVAAQVFCCGILPSILFDAPVYGLFDRSLVSVRRSTASHLGIAGRKCNIDLAFSFMPKKDPEILTGAQVVHQYVKEVWNASLPLEFRDPAGVSLGALGSGVLSYLKCNPSVPKVVLGPISALHRALDACGWTFQSPFQWLDRRGNVVHLPTQCPARVVSLFKNDYASQVLSRGISRASAGLSQSTIDTFASQGAMFVPLVRLYNKLDRFRAGVLMRIVTNGIWTNSDFFNVGYDINPACPACGSAHDSVFHRCFSCPAVESRAKSAIGDSVFDSIIQEGQQSLSGSRAIFACPSLSSSPSKATLFECIGMTEGQLLSPDDGFVYGDGSCYNSNIKGLSRAGWAFVQVDSEGNLLRAIYGCIPSALPQTSLCAEHFAFWAAFENASRCVYVGDCQHVLSAFASGFASVLASKSPHADFCKSAISRVDRVNRFGAVKKIKAHKSLDQTVEAGESVVDFHGNQHADRLAKEGARMHPPSDSDVVSFKALSKTVTEVALHMVDCLSGLRADRVSRFGRLQRLPSGFSCATRSEGKDAHKFVWNGKMWNCAFCLLRTFDPTSLPHSRLACSGVFPFADLLCDQRGHSLWVGRFADASCVVYCNKCWCYASSYARNLGKDCGSVCRASRNFLLRGQHPLSKLHFGKPMQLHSHF